MSSHFVSVPTRHFKWILNSKAVRSVQRYGSTISTDTSSTVLTSPNDNTDASNDYPISYILKESEWRQQATSHAERIYTILSPGMIPIDHPHQSSNHNFKRQQIQHPQHIHTQSHNNTEVTSLPWRGLDPHHPIYNFLIEYYGIRGAKGCRKLARWSPPLALSQHLMDTANSSTFVEDFESMKFGVLLEGASEHDDFGGGGILHSRGAYPYDELSSGYIYNPSLYFATKATSNSSKSLPKSKNPAAIPYLWHYTILHQTYTNPQPITHCFGLHEWAMVYHPPNSPYPPPPSAKYQAHLPRRVSQSIINDMVERKGVHCTHYDAIRFFAKDALPLLKRSHEETSQSQSQPQQQSQQQSQQQPQQQQQSHLPIQRSDQAHMEQPACVHANMDLFKLSLKLSPFVSSEIIGDALELAIACRRLDVAASPYDASDYGVDPVKIETSEGRSMYKDRQVELLHWGQRVRQTLIQSYEHFLVASFGKEILEDVMIVRGMK